MEGDFEKIVNISRYAIRQGNNPLTFLLNSDGGDLLEAIRIGRFAREMMATTYVYGNTIYDPSTKDGAFTEELAKEYSHVRFGAIAIKQNQSINEYLVRCYSSCVIIFYGGVDRYVSDNGDIRYGNRNMKKIPVIGIHRPYYDKEKYATLSPIEAKKKYQYLEDSVRDYLKEMGAPVSLIDRMFRKASNEIDLVDSEQFQKYYHSNEPFIEEWLIAKCGGYGPESSLNQLEINDYRIYEKSLKQAIESGLINSSEEYDDFTPKGMSQEYLKNLHNKIKENNRKVYSCNNQEIIGYQIKWALESFDSKGKVK